MLFDTAVNKLLKKQKILNEYANSEERQQRRRQNVHRKTLIFN